jgi:hypothetical protein
MTPPQTIPDEHHLSRHAGFRSIISLPNGSRIVSSHLFRLKEGEEYISVDWLEYFQCDYRERLDRIRNALEARYRIVGVKSGLAIVNIHEIKIAGRNNQRELSVMTTGDQNDPSHSGIYGLRFEPEDEIIAQVIANCVRVEDAWG